MLMCARGKLGKNMVWKEMRGKAAVTKGGSWVGGGMGGGVAGGVERVRSG